MKKQKNFKSCFSDRSGSILVYSLIVLAMMFAIVGSMSSVSILENKSAGSSQNSAQAFQTADSGVQLAIKRINDNMNGKIQDNFGSGNCSTGTVSLNDAGAGSYTLNFYTTGSTTAISDCGALVNTIASIQSVGTYGGTVRAVSVAVGDPYTVLLLHADGNNGSTTFVDSEAAPKTVTANNSVHISTSQPKIGTGSASFDGVNDYLSLPNSTDWNFGTGDFTIDFWENSSSSSLQEPFSFGNIPNNLVFDFNDGSGLEVFWNSSGGSNINSGAVGKYTDGTWHHIALVRQNNTMTLYVDGSSVATTSYSSAINLSGASAYYIGAVNAGANYQWNGNLDEIRISKGIARWTANFTPQTTPY